MNLPTLILHYESLKNKICQPQPQIRACLHVLVRPKNPLPWQKAVKMPLLMAIDPFNDLVCENNCEKYCFCEKLEQLIHSALDATGACAEQHHHIDVFYDVDFDGQFEIV